MQMIHWVYLSKVTENSEEFYPFSGYNLLSWKTSTSKYTRDILPKIKTIQAEKKTLGVIWKADGSAPLYFLEGFLTTYPFYNSHRLLVTPWKLCFLQ